MRSARKTFNVLKCPINYLQIDMLSDVYTLDGSQFVSRGRAKFFDNFLFPLVSKLYGAQCTMGYTYTYLSSVYCDAVCIENSDVEK